MRQSICITAFLLLTTFAAQAQKISVGLSGAFNQTFWNWKGKDIGKLDFGVGINSRFAIPVQYQLTPQFALRAELGVQHRATKKLAITDENEMLLGKGTVVYQGVEGSLLAIFNPFNRCQNLYLLGGVSADYITQNWFTHNKNLQKNLMLKRRQVDNTTIESPFYQRLQRMADVGAGYAHPLKRGRIFAEIRTQINTNDIISNDLAKAHFITTMINMGYFYQFR
jgi:hypothetical protein